MIPDKLNGLHPSPEVSEEFGMEGHPAVLTSCDTVESAQSSSAHMTPTTLAPSRDCLDCGSRDGMRLQNVAHTAPINIPWLYICKRCGTQLTIPPPPLEFPPIGKNEE